MRWGMNHIGICICFADHLYMGGKLFTQVLTQWWREGALVYRQSDILQNYCLWGTNFLWCFGSAKLKIYNSTKIFWLVFICTQKLQNYELQRTHKCILCPVKSQKHPAYESEWLYNKNSVGWDFIHALTYSRFLPLRGRTPHVTWVGGYKYKY